MANNNYIDDEARASLDNLLSSADLTNVSADGQGFEDLPLGYYLCEVQEAYLTTSKTSHLPMVSMQLKVVGDGYIVSDNEDDALSVIKGVNGRVIFKHYPFSDISSVKSFASDMDKFESLDGQDVSLLPHETWSTSETLEDGLEVLNEAQPRVWVHLAQGKKVDAQTGKLSVWTTLISWKRADALSLPTE